MQPESQALVPVEQEISTAAVFTYFQPVNEGRLLLMTVDSDAMAPTLNIGDHVLLDPTVTKIKRDGLYVFRSLDTYVIRRVKVDPVKRLWMVSCDNPAYGTSQDIPDNRPDCVVVGRIQWMGRKL